MMNINGKVILKFMCLLGVWSMVLIGLFKLHTNHIILQEEHSSLINGGGGRGLLQKEVRFPDATSTTTEKFMPNDVLIDNRTSE